MENNKNPNIRFKGFTDPWEQRKLGDNIVEYKEKTTINNQYPVLTSSRRGIFFQTDYYDGNQIASVDNTGYNIVPYGFFTYRHMSDDEIFHFNINDITENGIVSTLYPVFTTDENLDSRYLQYQLNYGKEFAKYAILQKQGGSRTYMYLNKLKELRLTIPNSVEEQKKISVYFMKLDSLITLHQRKYNKLLNVKKSMLEKMFPKNGSNIPEIRFKGFTDPWEQRKFTDITFLSGEKNKDNLPYESYSVTNDNGFVPQNEQFENGGTMATADKRMYYIVSKNSFAYNPARINVGSIGYYDGPENVIVSSLYEVFKTSEDIDDRYLWHWFKSNNFKKLIEQYQEGGVRLYFYYDKLCMCSLPTPSIQEQIKIGRYFDNLDNLITLHQRELEKLQNIKKSMLEKMFV